MSQQELLNYSNKELKQMCRDQGLSPTGIKADLVHRLLYGDDTRCQSLPKKSKTKKIKQPKQFKNRYGHSFSEAMVSSFGSVGCCAYCGQTGHSTNQCIQKYM